MQSPLRLEMNKCAQTTSFRRLQATALICQVFLLIVTASLVAFAADHSASAGSAKAADKKTTSSDASQILFLPSAITLNNPTGANNVVNGPTQVTVTMTIYNSEGNVVQPSQSDPLNINVYGAPSGVITPTQVVLTSGNSVTFTYNGTAFPNNMELAAWMNDPTNGGASLGTTLFIHGNRPPCSYGTASFTLDTTSNVPSEIKVPVVIGSDNPTQSQTKSFTLDTGSLGILVTKSNLVMGSNVHGPGAPGQKFYDSSGFVFTGNYYLAPVAVELQDGTFVQSNPIIILAIDGVHCHPNYSKCKGNVPPDLHYLGIGFNRNSTGTDDLFQSPADNVALELWDSSQNGTDINGGYVLSSSGVTFGITAGDASGFNTVTLDPSTTVPGDWNTEPGCYSFTSLSGSPQFCGTLLLDVGIPQMFLDLPSDQRPAGSYGSNDEVPDGVGMQIIAGPKNDPAMSYPFTAVQPPELPTGPAPTFAQWDNNKNIFVNIGRRPLLAFNYYYSGQCGQVGFQPN